jgi:hypothetical protein
MNKVEQKFKDRAAINRKSYFLFAKNDAIDFVNECRKEKIYILGIDGFYRIDDTTIQPSLDNSIDFSSLLQSAKVIDIYSIAIDFLRNRNGELFFEIVCSE